MKKNLLKIFASLSMLTLVVAGCDNASTTSESENQNNSATDTTTIKPTDTNSNTAGGSTNTNTGKKEEETYLVYVISKGNAEVTTSVTEAKPGEIVTITIEPQEGYRVESVEVNNKKLESNTYSFVMPNTQALIKVNTVLEDKDGYIIDGDIQAKLVEEENGIFVARNVKVENDANIWYSLGGESILGMIELDETKTFANIDYYMGEGYTIGGNAIYDFYYDPSNVTTPCYIQRVGVINLPTTESMIEDLFSGTAKSESSVNPAGVNKVEYTSSSKNEKYEWNLYSNNSSLATVTSLTTGNEKAIVYKAQQDDVFVEVDNYLEGVVDPTYVTRGDTTPTAGKYDIVKAVNRRSYQKLQEDVDYEANSYSHTMESLDFEMMNAYRNGYVGNIYNDVDVYHGSEIKSTRNEDETFTVELDSWVRWAESTHYGTENSIGMKSAYITYDVDITFTKAGGVLEGKYIETRYGDNYYDFSSNQLKAGYEVVEPAKVITFKYSYGDKLEGQPKRDVSKYFTQSIENITVKGITSNTEGVLSVGEDLVANILTEKNSQTNLVFECKPNTALDMWQYGPQESSNTLVIGPKNTSSPYDFRALSKGTSEITIGNHTKNSNDVTGKTTITVDASAFIKSVWMYTVYPYNDYDETFGADKGVVESGRIYTIQMAGTSTSGNYIMQGLSLTFRETTNTGYLDLSYNNETGQLTIDASKSTATEQTTVTYEIDCPFYADWPISKLSFTVLPVVDYPDSMVGTWENSDSSTSISFTNDTQGVIYVGTKTFDFTYSYDNTSGQFDNLKITNGTGDSYYLDMYIDRTDLALCVVLTESTYSATSWEPTITEYIGADVSDDDYNDYRYEVFFKK